MWFYKLCVCLYGKLHPIFTMRILKFMMCWRFGERLIQVMSWYLGGGAKSRRGLSLF